MSRNPHPEETVRKILEVSLRLFTEKGYDSTTIQDIVDALGMSKGAIYHHFKSKEDIIDSIGNQYYDDIGWFRDLHESKQLTGLQKLRTLFIAQLTDRKKLEIDQVSLPMLKNPRMIVLSLRSALADAAPHIQAFIEEGNADGSLHVAQPKELAEALMVLCNMWLPLFLEGPADFKQKVLFLRDMTDGMGLPVFDDAFCAVADLYYSRIFAPAQAKP